MIARTYVYVIAGSVAVWGTIAGARAENDVTVVPTSSSQTAPPPQVAQSDGTPVVHKSLHKKRHKKSAQNTASTNGNAPGSTATGAATESAMTPAPPVSSPVVVVGSASHPMLNGTVTVGGAPLPPVPVKPPPAISPTNIALVRSVPLEAPAPTIIISKPNPNAPAMVTPSRVPPAPTNLGGPLVETGLPVAHYGGIGAPITGVSTYVPAPPTVVIPPTGATTHPAYFASTLPSAVLPLTSAAQTTFSSASRTTTSYPSDIVFTSFSHHRKLFYPWKTDIITTKFWIGEGGSTISSTDNVASAWDANWRATNRGTDTPYDRNGFAPADHAATVNPFYVALPFNDLAFPDKAREYVPRSWHREPGPDGKQVSACKDRWVQIRNQDGRSCYAQWEDVGPLRYDHAEYVFGDERPDTYTRAGLDVSPAVAQYLGIDEDRKAITSWRFVDDEDVPPGQWLKYDEQAVIFTALHQMKNRDFPGATLPIQKSSEPIDDADPMNSNKKKVDASKG
jgi:hypothetical protein